MANGPEGAGFDYTVKQMAASSRRRLLKYQGGEKPIDDDQRRVPGGFGGGGEMQTGQAIVILRKPGTSATQSTSDVVEQVNRDLAKIAGVRAIPQRAPGPGARRRPAAAAGAAGARTTHELVEWRDLLLARMEANPGLTDLDSDYKETRPQLRVVINRERAADLGVSVTDIGRTLETMIGSRRVDHLRRGRRGIRRDRAGRPAEPRQHQRPAKTCTCARATTQLVPLSAVVTRQRDRRTRHAATASTACARSRSRRAWRRTTRWARRSISPAPAAREDPARDRADRLRGRVARVPAVRQRGDVHLRHGPADRVSWCWRRSSKASCTRW